MRPVYLTAEGVDGRLGPDPGDRIERRRGRPLIVVDRTQLSKRSWRLRCRPAAPDEGAVVFAWPPSA